MKFIIVFSFSLLFLVTFISCDANEPLPQGAVGLTLEDVSCTEAWMTLTAGNLSNTAYIRVTGNGKLLETLDVNSVKTTLYFDTLQPNTTYEFQAFSSQRGEEIVGNKLQFTTLDTTSHNFTWQTIEFGEIINQSHLFDVAIINENNIWAVGEIYMNDSLGQSIRYNAVHWDGSDWELKRIYYYGTCSAVTYPPLTAICTFDENNIVVTNGGSIGWFNGTTINLDCRVSPLLTGSINKMWGSSSNDLYAVGSNGNIAHYQNGSWAKIESGTDLVLSDITVNNLGEIFICGGNPSLGTGTILKSSNGNNFSTFVEGANIPESQLFNPKLYGSFSSIWVDQNNTLYSGGNILFQNKFGKWSYVKSLPENFIGGNPGVYYRGYITKVRGNVSNDMWIIGDRNTVRHFNGVSWQQIGLPYDPQSPIVWRSMSINDKAKVIVGNNSRKAIIMMIKK